MIVIDVYGSSYDIDLKQRTLTFANGSLKFGVVAKLYKGSPGAIFYDGLYPRRNLFTTGAIVSIEGYVPADEPVNELEPGHVVFRTNNSAYEIDQEQKLIRRLAGTNPTALDVPDLDWTPYDRIIDVYTNEHPAVYFPGQISPLILSRCREVIGPFIQPPPE